VGVAPPEELAAAPPLARLPPVSPGAPPDVTPPLLSTPPRALGSSEEELDLPHPTTIAATTPAQRIKPFISDLTQAF
jgi:hypothetical protein